MEKETTGTVVSVTKQRWLKINTRPLRIHASDGAVFPHIVKIRYTVDGKEYTCRKWIPAGTPIPGEGSTVKIFIGKGNHRRQRQGFLAVKRRGGKLCSH